MEVDKGWISMALSRIRNGRGWAGRLVAGSALAMSLVVAAPLTAYASVSTVPDDTARVNGTVYAVAQVGDRTIIAGDFTTVGGRTRNHVAAIKADGRLDLTFDPDVNGTVYAVAAAGDKVFLGGRFDTVGGEARANLAAVDATSGDVDPGWAADTVGDTPEVLALATSGSRLYAGGRFGGIDGTTRKRLAALDAQTGSVVTSFRPGAIAAAVKFIDPRPDGSTVFIGGAFDRIGTTARPAGVAELQAGTGAPTGFDPAAVGSRVTAMGLAPDASRLYFGVADNRVFAYDVATNALVWSVKNGGDTQAIAVSDTSVYLGGHFGNNITAKVKRQWIQSVDVANGSVTEWDPKLGGGSMGVWAIEVTPTSLLVGGEFIYVDGQNRPRFARFAGAP